MMKKTLTCLIGLMLTLTACTRTSQSPLSLPAASETESSPQPQSATPPALILLTAAPSAAAASASPFISRTPSLTPTFSQTPTASKTPSRTRRPSLTPTITLTPTLNYSNMLIRFEAPGPMAKLVSPINVVAWVAPEYTGVTRLELLGEDGRELYRKSFRTDNVRTYTRVAEAVSFEIPGAAEAGRLQISTQDQYGRLMAFNSVPVLLLSVGENQFTPAYEPLERVALRAPYRQQEISGGTLTVRGEIRPLNNTPVVLELVDIDGRILGSRVLYFDASAPGYQIFETTIPYMLAEKKALARLVIRQSDERITGLAYLYSLELVLRP
ncbi:MAG: hypothetical protein Fur0035_19230 [Anaerolineales bacterium]